LKRDAELTFEPSAQRPPAKAAFASAKFVSGTRLFLENDESEVAIGVVGTGGEEKLVLQAVR
jgi:hypothetical protein